MADSALSNRGVLENVMPASTARAFNRGRFWQITSALDKAALISAGVIRAMAQSVGNAIGAAWITVVGTVASLGIIALVGGYIATQVTLAHLSDKYDTLASSQKEMRSDMKEMKGQINQISRDVGGYGSDRAR